MKLKKILVLLLILSISTPTMSMPMVQAQEEEPMGWLSEEGWYYMENARGVTITGYNEDVEELVIPAVLNVDGKEQEVTDIYDEAFAESVSLKRVTIPATVGYIYDGAFRECTALEEVIYLEPENEERDDFVLKNNVFENCVSLKEVNFPSDIREIGDGVFQGCAQITNVVIPKSVWSSNVGKYVFANCAGLKEITIENNMQYMPEGLFLGCTELEKLNLPDTLTHIGKESFKNCTGLTDLQLPDSIRYIGDNAYEGCIGLGILVFPDSLNGVGERAFYGCTGFEEIQVSRYFEFIDNGAFEDCIGLKKLVLPEGFETIFWDAFKGCSSLTDIYLPATTKDIAENAFIGCNEEFTIHTTEDADEVISYARYDHEPEIEPVYDYYEEYTPLEYLTAGDWQYCLTEDEKAVICGYTGDKGDKGDVLNGALELVIPSTIGEENIPVVAIGNHALMGNTEEYISKIIIPSGVKEIGVSAFNKIFGLCDVIIPNSVETIHGTAFAGRTDVITIHGSADSTAIAYAKERGLQYNIPVTSMSFISDAIELEKEDGEYINVVINPEVATNKKIIWSTSDENIVTVDGYEKEAYVMGVNVGKAIITATSESDNSVVAQCIITVVEPQEEDGGTETPPAGDGETETPSAGDEGTETPPAGDEGTGTPPAGDGGVVTPPTDNTGSEKPSTDNGGTTTPPTDNGGTVKPPSDDSQTGGSNSSQKEEKELKVGTKIKDDKKTGTYRIIKTKSKGAEVAYVGVAKKTATTITIPKTVKIKGVTYKVIAIAENALKNNKKVKKVTIGTNITKIGKNAFQNCKKLKTIDIKSKKLKSVEKAAFKGIDSKAVIKVPKSKKKAYKALLKNKGQSKTVKIK